MMPVVAAAAAAFNLLCTGSINEGRPNADHQYMSVSEYNFQVIYRIDLDNRLWCAGDCVAVHTIASVNGDDLELEDITEPGFSSGLSISRATGRMARVSKAGAVVEIRDGACTKQPFSGMPARKF